jgi:hypothetical protein
LWQTQLRSPSARREGDEFFALGNARGQRLFAEHVLAGLKRIFGHGKVLRVGRANVDGIDRWIAEDLAIVGRNRCDGETRAQASRGFDVSAGDGCGFDRFHTAHGFEVHAAHEAGADE